MDEKITCGERAFRIVSGITILVLLQACGAGAVTLNVDDSGGSDYLRIQDAINGSRDGDTIIVRDGIYIENVKVIRPLMIMSENGSESTIIEALNPNNNIFEVSADYVKINGFTMKGASGNEKSAIYINKSSRITISNNQLISNYCGICLENSNQSNLMNNNANSNNNYGIGLYKSNQNNLINNNASSNSDYGIGLYQSNDNLITKNIVLDNVRGISLVSDSNNCGVEQAIYYSKVPDPESKLNLLRQFRDNAINNKYVDLYYKFSPDIKEILIEKPDISIEFSGLILKYLPAIEYILGKNSINANDFQIDIKDVGEAASFLEKLENEVRLKKEKIGEERASELIKLLGEFREEINKYEGKTFSQAFTNSIYFSIKGSNQASEILSTKNIIYHNIIAYNREYNAFDDRNNQWDNFYPSGGNYYNDYEGIDLKRGTYQDQNGSDGIGDTPYTISGGSIKDNYPLMAPGSTGPPETISLLFPEKVPEIQIGGTAFRWYKTIPNSEIYIDSDYLDYSQPDENGIFNVRVNTTKHTITKSTEISPKSASLTKNGKTISLNPDVFGFRLKVLPREFSTSWFAGDSIGVGGGIIAYVEGHNDIDFKLTNSNHNSILEMTRDKNDQLTVGAAEKLFEKKVAKVVEVKVLSGDVNVKVKGMQGSQKKVDYENANSIQKLEGALYILTSTISLSTSTSPLMYEVIDIISKSLSSDLKIEYYESGAGISTGGSASLINIDIGYKEKKDEEKEATFGNVNIGLENEIGGSFKERIYPDAVYPAKYYQEYLTEFVFESQGLSPSFLGNDILSLYPGGKTSITSILGKNSDENTILGKLMISSEKTPIGTEYQARDLTYDYGSIFGKTTTTVFEDNNPSVSSIWQNYIDDLESLDEGSSAVINETRGGKTVIELPLEIKIRNIGVSLSPVVRMGQVNNYVVINSVVHDHIKYSLEEYEYDSLVQGTNKDLEYIVGSLLAPVGDVLKNSFNTVQEWAEAGKEIILDGRNKAYILFNGATQFFTSPSKSNGLQMSISPIELIISTYAPGIPAQNTYAIMNSIGISSAFVSSASGSGFIIGNITDFQPYNVSFTPAAKLSLNYTESDLTGIDESNISIFQWNITKNAWLPLISSVNTKYKNVSSMITGFGTYAIGYDDEKPMISGNISDLFQGNITFNTYLQDNGSGINEASIKLYLDNLEQNFTYNIFSGLFYASLNASPGNHIVKIFAEDTSGNSNYIEKEIISIKPAKITNITINNIENKNLELAWKGENGSFQINQYLIYRNGEFISNTTQANFTLNYTDSATYTVYPVDLNNNTGIGKSIIYQATKIVPKFSYDWNNTIFPTEDNPIVFNAIDSYMIYGTIESDIIKFQWIFDGDRNNIITGKIVNHIFKEPGYHNVTLEIENNNQIQGNLTRILYVAPNVVSQISFIDPTPPDNAILSQNYVYINTTIRNSSTAFIDWNNSLKGWWRFNNESGENQTVFRDWSSLENNGTCSLLNCPEPASGKFGSALYFDGVNDYLNVANSENLNVTDMITIEVWINPAISQEKCWDNVSGNYGVLSKVSSSENSTDWSWQLRYGAPGGGCYLGYHFNGRPYYNRWITVGQNLTPGKWYHIAGTFNGNATKIYVNGKLKQTKNMSFIKSYGNKLLIGNDGWGNVFRGKLDEVRIHNRALNKQEIKASYNAGIHRLYRNFTNITPGNYNYRAYSQNLAGNLNQTEMRRLIIN